jgi:hypothetical protein
MSRPATGYRASKEASAFIDEDGKADLVSFGEARPFWYSSNQKQQRRTQLCQPQQGGSRDAMISIYP